MKHSAKEYGAPNFKLRNIISQCGSVDERVFSGELLLSGQNQGDWLFVYEEIPELRKKAFAKIRENW